MGRFDRNSSRRDDRQVTMYPAVCDECGRECKVPFKPSNDKPIYCSSCFEQKGGNSDRRDSRRSFDSNRRDDRRDDKKMYSAVCDDCGERCEVPFRPSSDKPIYCSSCFEKRGNVHDGSAKSSSGGSTNVRSEQLDLIISKLDLILQALGSKSKPEEKKIEKKKVEKTVKAKKETVKKPKAVKKSKKE